MAIVDLIVIGLAVTLEPIPLTGFLLVLGSERGARNGMAYIAGWVLCLVLIVVATVFVTGGKPPKPSTAPSTAILAVKLALGAVLLGIAMRQRARRGRPKKPSSWMSRVDSMSPWAAALLAIALQPWVLIGAGAATVAELHVSSVGSFVLLACFAVLCTSSLLVLEWIEVRHPEQAAARREAIRAWIDRNRDEAIIILSVLLGLWLIGDSLYLLVTTS